MILQKQVKRRQRRGGFTLMEILVVVAIIVALAGVGGYYFLNSWRQAQIDSASLQVRGTLTTAVRNFMLDHQVSPDHLDMLLVRDPVTGKGPYVAPEALYDPWKQKYVLEPGTFNPEGVPLIYTVIPGTTTRISNF